MAAAGYLWLPLLYQLGITYPDNPVSQPRVKAVYSNWQSHVSSRHVTVFSVVQFTVYILVFAF